jgi:hypothetical protein
MAHTLWRQYDSYSGRWTAPDPYQGSMEINTPQSFNRYTYVNDDPVNQIDPTGLSLADMGVYQTANPEAARKVAQAEDQGVKNFVTQLQKDTTVASGGRAASTLLHELGHSGTTDSAQTDNRPRITNMVSDNLGVGKLANGEYRFKVGANGLVGGPNGHDGDHVLGAMGGSMVRAITGLTGTVLTWYVQEVGTRNRGPLFTVFILLRGSDLVMVLKDLDSLSRLIRRAPQTSPGKLSFLNRNGTPRSRVDVNVGDEIGTTAPWTNPRNQTGMHFTFVHFQFIQQYRENLSQQKGSPAEWFVAPCGSSSPVSCK